MFNKHSDPWYLTAGADESAKESESYIDSKDWDIYPFPSTDYCGNTIKVVMDPICIPTMQLMTETKNGAMMKSKT